MSLVHKIRRLKCKMSLPVSSHILKVRGGVFIKDVLCLEDVLEHGRRQEGWGRYLNCKILHGGDAVAALTKRIRNAKVL